MSTAAVLAHFDPDGLVAPHVRRQLQALRTVADLLVVVTTCQLTGDAQSWLRERATLVERPNEGYDFCSWKAGLAVVPGWPDADRVILVNDSVVGPLVPYGQMIETMALAGAPPFWGAAINHEVERHLQSFFMVFEPSALASPMLRAFWAALTPLPTRAATIVQYERGLSRLMTTLGLAPAGYFRPSAAEQRLARVRRARVELHRRGTVGAWAAREQVLTHLRPGAPVNPMIGLWDRALDRRLPFIKIETLRDDPYGLGRERMLTACEQALPAELDGVRELLTRTASRYDRIAAARRAGRA